MPFLLTKYHRKVGENYVMHGNEDVIYKPFFYRLSI